MAVRESQCGGVAKGGTDFAVHRAETYLELAKVRGTSVTLMYLVVIGALYSWIRSSVIDMYQTPSELGTF